MARVNSMLAEAAGPPVSRVAPPLRPNRYTKFATDDSVELCMNGTALSEPAVEPLLVPKSRCSCRNLLAVLVLLVGCRRLIEQCK